MDLQSCLKKKKSQIISQATVITIASSSPTATGMSWGEMREPTPDLTGEARCSSTGRKRSRQPVLHAGARLSYLKLTHGLPPPQGCHPQNKKMKAQPPNSITLSPPFQQLAAHPIAAMINFRFHLFLSVMWRWQPTEITTDHSRSLPTDWLYNFQP